MKILLVTEDVPAPNLACKHSVLLANALVEAGHQVEMLGCLRAGVETNNGFVGKMHTEIDFSNIGLKQTAMGIFNPIRGLLMAWRIWSAIKRIDYKSFDAIHYHGHIAELGVLVPRHINYVQTVHDQGSECMTMVRFRNGASCALTSPFDCAGCATKNQPNFLQKITSASAVKLHRYLARKAFTRHKVIFVSEFVRNRFKEVVGKADGLNAVVVQNFTDARVMQSIIQSVTLNKSKNLRPVALLVGRIHASKGQADFLESLPIGIFEKIEVRIAGDGPDLAMLKEKYEKLGVKFLGFLPQQQVYKETIQADACIVSSICEEACSTTVLEALSLGKTVFALARGGIPEQAKYSQYPNQLRLFDDVAAMATALTKIDYLNTHQVVSFTADISARLPEIVKVYSSNIRLA